MAYTISQQRYYTRVVLLGYRDKVIDRTAFSYNLKWTTFSVVQTILTSSQANIYILYRDVTALQL
jgi:long-subunit fatty acid transport protein